MDERKLLKIRLIALICLCVLFIVAIPVSGAVAKSHKDDYLKMKPIKLTETIDLGSDDISVLNEYELCYERSNYMCELYNRDDFFVARETYHYNYNKNGVFCLYKDGSAPREYDHEMIVFAYKNQRIAFSYDIEASENDEGFFLTVKPTDENVTGTYKIKVQNKRAVYFSPFNLYALLVPLGIVLAFVVSFAAIPALRGYVRHKINAECKHNEKLFLDKIKAMTKADTKKINYVINQYPPERDENEMYRKYIDSLLTPYGLTADEYLFYYKTYKKDTKEWNNHFKPPYSETGKPLILDSFLWVGLLFSCLMTVVYVCVELSFKLVANFWLWWLLLLLPACVVFGWLIRSRNDDREFKKAMEKK